MSTPLIVEFNCPEPRIAKDRLVVSGDGSTWDMRVSTLYREPVGNALMLRPLPATDAWQNTFDGYYRRYGVFDYTMASPANWVEYGRTAPGDLYVSGLGTNETVFTTVSFGANQAIYIAAVVAGTGTENAVILECGWGTPLDPATVSLRFRANGDAEVYKGTKLVGVYDFRSIDGDVSAKRGQGKGDALAGRTVSFMLIPMPPRSLLVLSNVGGGFSHAFDDLNPDTIGNAITQAGTFFWRVPTGLPVVQMCPLRYLTLGTVYSPPVKMRYAPSTGQAFTSTTAADFPATGTVTLNSYLVKPDLTAYTPNGAQQEVRLAASMTGDSTVTPFLYAVDLVFPRTTTTTYNAPFDILPYCTKLDMEVPESGPSSLHITCKEPGEMETEGLAKARLVGNIPVRVSVGGKDIFRGTTGEPQTEVGAGHKDGATVIEWTASDRETEFDMYSFRDTFPYDGLALTDAIKDLVRTAGFTDSDMDVSVDTYGLPYTRQVAEGKWQLLPQRGDTAGSWIKRLWQDYAQTWVYGWKPTATGYKFSFRRPDTLSNTPLLELFETTAGAKAFGIAPELITRRIIRKIKELPMSASANEVLAVGYDESTDTYPQAQYNDADSQNPSLAPSARPANWQGRVVAYQLIDQNLINNQTTATRAKDILVDRATKSREIIESEIDFMIRQTGTLPLWKGDVVRIYTHAAGEKKPDGTTYSANVVRGDYRILAIPSIEFMLEGDRAVPIRPATYRLLKIGPGT